MNEESVAAKLSSVGRARVPMALVMAGGAAIDVVSRFLLGTAINAIASSGINAASTTVINLLGCLLFGLVSSTAFVNPRLAVFCGIDSCGGFITFSVFVIPLLAQADALVMLIVSAELTHLLCCPLAYWLGTKRVREVVE